MMMTVVFEGRVFIFVNIKFECDKEIRVKLNDKTFGNEREHLFLRTS